MNTLKEDAHNNRLKAIDKAFDEMTPEQEERLLTLAKETDKEDKAYKLIIGDTEYSGYISANPVMKAIINKEKLYTKEEVKELMRSAWRDGENNENNMSLFEEWYNHNFYLIKKNRNSFSLLKHKIMKEMIHTIKLLTVVIIALVILFSPLYWTFTQSPWFMFLFIVSWIPSKIFVIIFDSRK